MSQNKLVITGMGAVTPVGIGVEIVLEKIFLQEHVA